MTAVKREVATILGLLEFHKYVVSYAELIEDRDIDTTSYWVNVTFEASPGDYACGVQLITVTMTCDTFDAEYGDRLDSMYWVVQQPHLERMVPNKYVESHKLTLRKAG